VAASFAGFSGVGLGAFGAHALKTYLKNKNMMEVWHTGVQYHLIHSVALLGCWVAMRTMPEPSPSLQWAARFYSVGMLLFSGSLYGLCLGAPKWTGIITPMGGLCLMAGWGCIAFAAMNVGNQGYTPVSRE
jgi:uncharacterized membrane protein YgdD (TMEM256/DUF423 family)